MKKILNLITEFYKKNILTKLIYFVVILLISVGIAFLYENLSISYAKSNQKDFKDYIKDISYQGIVGTGIYTSENKEFLKASIAEPTITYIFKEPIYIDKLNMQVDTSNQGGIIYEVEADTRYVIKDNIYHAEVFPGQTDVININAEVSEITLKLFLVGQKSFIIDLSSPEVVPEINYLEIIFISVIAFLILETLIFILNIETNLSTIFWVSAIPMLLIFSFLLPPHYTWDEYSHLTRAVYLAENQLEVNENSEAQFPYNFESLDLLNYRSSEDFYDYLEFFNSPDGTNLIKEPRHIATSAKTYIFIPYLTSALGVKIAQYFDLNAYYYVVFPRLINGILYLIFAFFGIKLFCGNKLLLHFMALLPFMFYICCSSALNAIILGPFILLIGVITYYRKNKEKQISSFLYLGLLLLISLITIARMTYGFVFFLLLLLPKDQFKNKFIGKLNLLILIVLSISLMSYVFYYSNSVSGFTNFEFEEEVKPSLQIESILHNPLTYTYRLWKNTESFISLDVFTELVRGAYIGTSPKIFALLCAVTLFYVLVSGDKNDLYLNDWFSRLVIFIVCLLCYAATMTSMYVTMSEYNGGEIVGMQWRYVIPFFFFLLPVIEGKNFYLKTNPKLFRSSVVIVNTILLIMITYIIMTKYYL